MLDGFLGSGSTVLAAERVWRRCFGTELDPLYVDTIIRQWQSFTGGVARHVVSGLTSLKSLTVWSLRRPSSRTRHC